ncbi:MAG TPA: class II aldolase/adducin family protein [Mycobacteriales bacterium]|nr:class II aldolase/adducin family protein [Mycobacteriales bacterium]
MNALEDLVQLSRDLGDPAADLAILGEGNTSADLGDGSYLVKASGTSLQYAEESSFVRLDRSAVMAVIDDPQLAEDDSAGLEARMQAAVTDREAPKPSIEAMLHAVTIELAGAAFTGHTHPTAITGILCSDAAELLVRGHLFPDQVIVCGPHPLLVPYVDPGLALGRILRDRLIEHIGRYAAPPKLIYLVNHGIVALGGSAAEVRQVTAMAVKAARALRIACSTGRPVVLPESSVRALDTRPDEIHRRAVLAGEEGAS